MKTQRVLLGGICSWVLSSILGGALLAACASSGTEPHAMTASQHQAAANAEEHAAGEHQAQFDPAQARPAGPRAPSSGAYSACLGYETSTCYTRWKSTENPTDRHVKNAEHHRKLAAKHREASQALKDAEQRFCSGVPEADRDLSPFDHREDIAAAQGLKKRTEAAYGASESIDVVEIQQIEKQVLGPDLRGARITFRAVPGMTGEWLQRVVDCHLARNAVIGNDSEMTFCPLAVPHATASVTSTGSGFAVDITSNNDGSVREIIKRAWALGPSGPTIEK